MVGDSLIVEVKATERTLPVHEAQLLTHLKLSGYRLGFLINFNVTLIKGGIKGEFVKVNLVSWFILQTARALSNQVKTDVKSWGRGFPGP